MTKSLEPDGDGTIIDTPDISIGNGAHRNLTELSLCFRMLQDMMDVLLLFVRRSGWETTNIPCNCEPGAMDKKVSIALVSNAMELSQINDISKPILDKLLNNTL